MKKFLFALLSQFLILPCIGTNKIEDTDSCQLARTRCAYRTNCAWALKSYMVDCADVLAGRTSSCPWACKRALISLTSSDVGYQLSTCECAENDEFCRKSKERTEVCRPEVTKATDGDTVVPCSVAQWICHADPLCSTALDYYHRLCRSLFHGRKCTHRCNNSLAILDRQEKAAKLRNCYCDGSEDFPCHSIRKNTQKLCYGRDDWVQKPTVESFSTTKPSSAGSKANLANKYALVLCVVASLYTCLHLAFGELLNYLVFYGPPLLKRPKCRQKYPYPKIFVNGRESANTKFQVVQPAQGSKPVTKNWL